MNNTSHPFSRIIFDLDGVLYRGHTVVPGAAQALSRIRSCGIPISFITNNATRSRATLRSRLAKMGIYTRQEELMTSAYATACYLRASKPKPSRIYVVGERGLRDELRSAKLNVLPTRLAGLRASATTFSAESKSIHAKRANFLVTGLDRKFDYSKLAAALDALMRGARWVACNLDPTLPMEHGAHPGAGSIAASLAYASGQTKGTGRASHMAREEGAVFSNTILRQPDVVIGKPNTYMLELMCKGYDRDERKKILFVGDRLDMDIAFAKSAGLSSLLVLTGVSTRGEAKKARGILQPGVILDSVADLPEWLGI